MTPENGGNSQQGVNQTTYTRSQLQAMTKAQIEALAQSLGYVLTTTLKADMIQEFLDIQNS